VSRPRANELDGKTWTRYSISVWSDIRKSAGESRLRHPAMFPAELARRLIECFLEPGDQAEPEPRQGVVLDPFCGTGATLAAAHELGKRAIGVELSADFVAKARERLGLALADGSCLVHQADVRRLGELVAPESVDLVITSPPYWDILTRRRTADGKAIRNYGDDDGDLGRISDYHQFLSELAGAFDHVRAAMRPGTYCCVVVMDVRKKATFYPLHADLATALRERGFIYDDLIIWDRRAEYNNLRPLGYPSVFRVNRVHEFVLVFRKP
jgi:DNA modification methylase